MSVSVFFYDLLLLMGVVISFEDWREKKIRNRWILAGLVLCAGGYAYLLLNSALGHWKTRWMGLGEVYLPWTFYTLSALHAFLVVAAGLATWWMRLWPAGDAKLYIVFGLLLSLIDHNIRGFPFIVFLKLLINIFVPAGLYVLATVLLGSVFSVPKFSLAGCCRGAAALWHRTSVRAREIWPYRLGFSIYLLNVFLIFFALELLERRFQAFDFMRTMWGQLGLLSAMYLLWEPLSRFLRGKRFWRAWLLLGLWWLLDPLLREKGLGAAVIDAGTTVLIFGVFFSVLQAAVTLFLRKENEEAVSAKDLVAGMILSQQAWENLRDFGREQKQEAPGRYADGLFPEDVEKLKSWEQLPDFAVTVYRATPFAIWVYLGAILTLLLPKNVMYWLFRICYDPHGAWSSYLRLWGF